MNYYTKRGTAMKYCERCGELLPKGEAQVCLACATVQNSGDNNEGVFYNMEELPLENDIMQSKSQQPYHNSYAAFDDNGPTFGELPLEDIKSASVNSHSKSNLRAKPISEVDNSATRMMPPVKRATEQASGKAKAPVRRSTQSNSAANKHRKRTQIALIAMIAALLILIATLGTAIYMGNKYNINDDFAQLKSALLAGDSTTVKSMMYSESIDITSADVSTFMRSFGSEEKVNALMAQLAMQVEGTGEAVQYSAIFAHLEPAPLGHSELKLGINPVSLQVTSNAASTHVTLNGVDAQPSEENALLFDNLMPGLYTVVVRGETQLGQTVEGSPVDVEVLSSDAPATFDGALPISDVTVSGTMSDTAIIFVNGTQVSQTPVNMVVSLPQLLVGSNISMEYTTPSGAVLTASVQFNDRANTALEFTNHTMAGGIPSHAEIETIMRTFYTSYINANNARDINLLTNVTPERKALMTGEITREKNEVSTFSSSSVSTANIEESFDGDAPSIIFNANAKYTGVITTKDADDNDVTSSLAYDIYYTVEIIYTQDAWLVNRLAIASKELYDAGQFAPFA